MLDIESLVFERLTAALPDVWVSSELDPRIEYPAVVYALSGDGQTGNGPGIWRVTLEVNVLVTPAQYRIVQRVYDEVKSWPGTRSPSGHVTRVEDGSLLSRTGSTPVAEKTINQYTGTFDLIVRP